MPLRIPDIAEVTHWRERWTDELAGAVAQTLVEGTRNASAKQVRDTLIHLNRSLAEVTRYFLLNRLPHRFHTADPRGQQAVVIIDPKRGKIEIDVPVLDLRGIPWPRECDAAGIVLPLAMLSGAELDGVSFHKAQFPGAQFTGASLKGTSFKDCDLRRTRFWAVNATGASFQAARMGETDMRHANLFGADLRGTDLSQARIHGGYFRMALVGSTDDFDPLFDSEDDDPTISGPVRTTRFSDTRWQVPLAERFQLGTYWDRCGRSDASLWGWEKLSSRWFHTDMMGVEINRADMRNARDLEQFVRDQQRMRQIGQKHPRKMQFWMLLTDGGMAWRRFLLAALLVVFGYGGLYWFLSLPTALRFDTWLASPVIVPPAMVFGRISEFIIGPLLWGSPPFVTLATAPTHPGLSWLYWHWISLDTFTNLGFPAAMPANGLGWLLVLGEHLLGWIILGLLLISLASRLARRWM